MIKFQGVNKWFKSLHVLKDIDLHVKQGEVVVVCGPSGSGKSTLIRTINQLEPIERGSLVVDGFDLSDKKTDINKLRAEVGFVFQQFNLYPHLSTLANITLAPTKIRNTPRKEAEEQAMVLLERVGLANKRDAFPSQLSGGQQQRVAIARAMVADPDILVADEPTGDLDRVSAAEILSLMERLVTDFGKTIIMVTHDPKSAEKAGRVVHLEKGELVASAPPAAQPS